MGTLVLDNITKASYQFDIWTTTSDYSDPEHGTVNINITKKEGDATYGLYICLADYDPRWIKKFIQRFVENIEFRNTFLLKEDATHEPHPYETIELQNTLVNIDSVLVPAIKALNASGAITSFCCQGGCDSTPYITLKEGHFPDELVHAWKGAQFGVTHSSVYAHAPVGLCASHLFIQSLTDWVNGTLDITGETYRLKEKRPSSLPKLPKGLMVSTDAVNENVKVFLSKGQKHLKFKDFAALKSGRDPFSSIPLDVLLTRVSSENATKIHTTFQNDTLKASALRWLLRGLPVDLALKKIHVDQEIAANIRR